MYALWTEGLFIEQSYATAVVLVIVIGLNTVSASIAKRLGKEGMMDKFRIQNLDLYYGDFQALKN